MAGLLARFVKQHHITQLVMGKNRKPCWLDFFKGSIIPRVLALTSATDVRIIDRLAASE